MEYLEKKKNKEEVSNFFPNVEDWHKEEEEKYNNYIKVRGNYLGYIGEPCCNCGRCRVEKYDNGNLICEKCGTDQKTKETYSNEFGSYMDYDF